MEQRVSLITLGVSDVSAAQAFYEALGWHLDGGVDDEIDHVAFFQAGGLIFALWDRGKLERDSGVEDATSRNDSSVRFEREERLKGVKTQISLRLRLAGRPLFGEEAD
jgi:catechol 2,3-dioxygenase-like lactoylglutathione lyase family enzyme